MNQNNIKQILPPEANLEFSNNSVFFETNVSKIKALAIDLRDNKNLQLKFITATDETKETGYFKIWYVFGETKEKAFIVPFIKLKAGEEFPSLFPELHEAWNYERKIKTFFGLTPAGNPDQRPIILHEDWPSNVFPLRKDFILNSKPAMVKGEYKMQVIEGEGIYEIPVGPIHAGIIEPGHFRFSVAGEEIVNLEAKLGYVHKGSEKLFENLPLADKIKLSEKISGDSSFSHSLAFCQALEQLSGTTPTKRTEYLRVIFSELERIANHFGDIGAIMVDAGFNFGGANGSRLREMIMQINERLTGSRFLRGVNICGGVTKDINTEQKDNLILDLENISKDFEEVMNIASNSASLLNRLKTTGIIAKDLAQNYGATGIGAKCVGISNDVRVDFPYAAYNDLSFNEIVTETAGDVNARYCVRVREVRASIDLIIKALRILPEGPIKKDVPISFKKNTTVITTTEGWRGEILYFVKTDNLGNIERVAPRDPSFINWPLVCCAVIKNIVPDFPLINKSFNLSYSGNDL